MKKVLVAAMLLGVVSVAMGAAPPTRVPLPPGECLTNPDVGSGTPFSTTLPSYFTPENLVLSHYASCDPDAPLVPGGELESDFVGDIEGRVISKVYHYFDLSGQEFYGVEFQFYNTSGGAPLDITHVTIGDNPVRPPLAGVEIDNAGADGSGKSTPLATPTIATQTGFPSWNDGDPYYIARDTEDAGQGLAIYWKVGGDGTVLRNGDYSSRVFFEMDAGEVKTVREVNIGILDSGSVSTARVLLPTSISSQFPVIAEPASLLLLGLGGGLGLVVRRRRRSSLN